jgi:thiol-disulfide isomerase/thioredoxin
MFYNLKRIGFLFAFCLVVIASAAVQELSAATKVPDFSYSEVAGDERIDIRDYRGKVVLINFWATWCGPCLQEMPSLVELQKKYGPQGFAVIGVSIDEGGSGVVAKMIKKIGVNYPIVIGNRKLGREFGGIYGVPTSFLVDRSGNVIKRYTGLIDHQVFAEDIMAALR